MSKWLAGLFGRAEPQFGDAWPMDAAAFSALHGACFSRGWSEAELEALLVDPNVIAHKALVGRQLGGFILSRRGAEEAEILSIAVVRRQRGRGLARRLLDLHLRRLAGLGVRTLFLEVDAGNAAAGRLYWRAGFHQVGERQGYYAQADGSASNALVLRRDI